jgi:hypothetical protein
MNRTQAIDLIVAMLDTLPDDRIEVIAEVVTTSNKSTVYSTLSDAGKADVDAALDELDRGEGSPGEQLFSEMHQRIAAAKAGA